jgi:hypothetical protein
LLKPLEELFKNKILFAATQKRKEVALAQLKTLAEKEAEIKGLRDSLSTADIHERYKEVYDLYLEVLSKNEEYRFVPDTENLEVASELKLKPEEFRRNFSDKVDRRRPLNDQLGPAFDEKGDFVFSKDTHLATINSIVDKVAASKVALKSGFTEKIVMLSLLNDYFLIDFDLFQDGDRLVTMSPGKRGIILFQLFLHLSKSKNPILIDQPEDNLDNRTVYQELNEFIKSKKGDRQIIIVSHNPNLVVSTDSENIIVANQGGKNKSGANRAYQFEYVNGAIECSFENQNESGVLYKKGIKEHVCDILEGGSEAFEKRESKYGFK